MVTIRYQHDGGPSEETIIIKRYGYFDGKYHLQVECTDATDYERVILVVRRMFRDA